MNHPPAGVALRGLIPASVTSRPLRSHAARPKKNLSHAIAVVTFKAANIPAKLLAPRLAQAHRG
jgi:hypothetical protein